MSYKIQNLYFLSSRYCLQSQCLEISKFASGHKMFLGRFLAPYSEVLHSASHWKKLTELRVSLIQISGGDPNITKWFLPENTLYQVRLRTIFINRILWLCSEKLIRQECGSNKDAHYLQKHQHGIRLPLLYKQLCFAE